MLSHIYRSAGKTLGRTPDTLGITGTSSRHFYYINRLEDACTPPLPQTTTTTTTTKKLPAEHKHNFTPLRQIQVTISVYRRNQL